jgi:diguanylate cyclase (GGDEF)-like protein
MIGAPRSTRSWRGRYRAQDGAWRWIEAVNTNRLDDSENPGVYTVMYPARADFVSAEDELRARDELLTRLSDALPVGIFQIDQDCRVVFTNGRLHHILGAPPAGDLESQFAVLLNADHARLVSAIEAVFAGEEVDDLELHFHVEVPHPDFAATRVCQVSLRPLTNGALDGVTGAIGSIGDVTDRVELRRELELRASTDSLTGCLNRGATFEMLDRALRRAVEAKTGVSAIFVDLDGFKVINDRYGHSTGDQALLGAADRIRSALRASDVVGRLGGDEFLVICPEVSHAEEGLAVAARIRQAVGGEVTTSQGAVALAASIGVAWTGPPGEAADSLIARADAAMYQSKLAGAGSVVASASD